MKKLYFSALLLLCGLLFACSPSQPEPTPDAEYEADAIPAPPVSQEDLTTPVPGATPAPTPVFDPEMIAGEAFCDEYVAAKNANDQVSAYLIVPNTAISYPVALGTDNDYYLHTTLFGQESKSGSIFFDYRTDASLLGGHLIVYGHNMKAGTMFHDLNSYKHQEFFDNNRIITLYAGTEKREYEVYAAFIAPPDVYFIRTAFSSGADFLSYMEELQALSKFETDVVLTEEDQILTLTTCTYEVEDGRFVVQAKRIS